MRPLRSRTLLFPALLLVSMLEADNLYVSNSGSNGNDGSREAPYATVQFALAASRAGDFIRLERGSVFRESGLVAGPGRTLDAYGDAREPLPVISGSRLLRNWQEAEDVPGAWETRLHATVSEGEPSLYVEEQRRPLARFPNEGWLRVEAGTTTGRIVDAELRTGPAGDWSGGQVRWRKWSWWYETRPILSDSGDGTLRLGGGSPIPGLTGIDSGYYIDNHPAALDAPGEWYWDKEGNRLLLIPPGGEDPADLRVELAVAADGLRLENAEIRNVVVRHYTQHGISVTGASRIEDCRIEDIWDNGIAGTWGAGGSVLRGNTIRDILNVAIAWNENPSGAGGTRIEGNHIERSGMVPGMGGSGPWHAAGVIISNAPFGEKGVQLHRNRIEDTGYAGIILGSDGQTVTQNVIRRAMSTLNDGAGIYTNCNYSFIRENIILDTEGDLASSHPWTPLGAGIWLEFLENFHHSEVENNTVYGSGGDGLFLPNNFDCTIRGNTFLSNLHGGMAIGGHEDGRSDGRNEQRHRFEDNLVGIGALPWEPEEERNLAPWGPRDDACLIFKTHGDRDLDFGSMSGTTFLTRDGEDLVVSTAHREYALTAWQEEESAWADPDPRALTGEGYLFINDTATEMNFPLPAATAWRTLEGEPAGGEVRIAPFRSRVLLSESGVVPGLPGYLLASELPGREAYAAWAAKAGLEGAAALPTVDADGDRAANILEYFFMTSAMDAAERPRLSLCPMEGAWAATLRLRERHPGWQLRVEHSDDLAGWEEVEMEAAPESASPGTTLYRVTASASAPGFFRVQVSPVR